MSTILTIITNKSETRVVFDQPLRSISEIQLVDYDFPEEYVEFKTEQTITNSDDGNILLALKPGKYPFNTLYTILDYAVSGVSMHKSYTGYHLMSKNSIGISEELSRKLSIVDYSTIGRIFAISWPHHQYYVYCDIATSKSVLGQITTASSRDLKPTNLLAVIPSKSEKYPSIPIQVENHPINYLTLSVLYENGNKLNFNDKPFRINLRVVH